LLIFFEVEGTKQKVSGACPAGGVDTYDLDATSVIGGKGKSVELLWNQKVQQNFYHQKLFQKILCLSCLQSQF